MVVILNKIWQLLIALRFTALDRVDLNYYLKELSIKEKLCYYLFNNSNLKLNKKKVIYFFDMKNK